MKSPEPPSRLTAGELEQFLLAHVPLAAAMGMRVVEAGDDGVRLRLPLAPNLNHHHTAFGGSVAAAAVLAGWSMLHVRLANAGVAARTVVADSHIRYLQPIASDFEAIGLPPLPSSWEAFLDVLGRRGRARLDLMAQIWPAGEGAARRPTPAATCAGAYVAMIDR